MTARLLEVASLYTRTARVALTMVGVCLVVIASPVAGDARATMSIATGGPSGLYYPFGGAMASIWSRSFDDVNVKAEVTGGSLVNVIQVARLESDIGIAMADVVTDAYRGEGRFPFRLPIRVLFSAYPNLVHMLTLEDSGIRSVADLEGKRVSLGAAGSGTAIAAENVLTGLGLTLTDINDQYLNFGNTTSALKDGTIDAGFVVGGLGIAAVTELAVTRDLHLINLSSVELDRLEARFPAYTRFNIPGATYNGVADPVAVLGIWSSVVVNEAMDEALAYRLTCAVFANRQRLLDVTQVASATTIENADALTAVPLHAGAAQYLAAHAAGLESGCEPGVRRR